MSRRPPFERLPLVIRKNIRDGWEYKKGEYQEMLSEILGQPWAIDINPMAILPYTDEDSWGRTCIGDAISSYVGDAIYQLRKFIGRHGDEARNEVNEICSAHILTLDYDDTNTVSYCGIRVSSEGRLVIVFKENYFGTNISDAANEGNLTKALNDAPSQRPMNFIARRSIWSDYDLRIEKIQEELSKIFKQEISLVPNFEANFDKLKSNADTVNGWEHNFGNAHLAYFEGLVSRLDMDKFEGDNSLLQGLLNAMDKHAIHIRVVDQIKRDYNEAVIEGGILYLQTTPRHFGVNTSDVARDILNIL